MKGSMNWQNNKHFTNLRRNKEMKMNTIKRQDLKHYTNPYSKSQPHTIFFMLIFFVVIAISILTAPGVLAVQAAPDTGLSTGVTNLLLILNNKLTPVILTAGCLAALVYSLAIAQPKPFLLSLVTLCGFGFAKAWISGTYALIG